MSSPIRTNSSPVNTPFAASSESGATTRSPRRHEDSNPVQRADLTKNKNWSKLTVGSVYRPPYQLFRQTELPMGGFRIGGWAGQ